MFKIKVLIIGAGAIGLAIGTSLISQNIDVSFYASQKTAVSLKENGVGREGLFRHLHFDSSSFTVYTDYNQIPKDSFNFLIVATKTSVNYQVAEDLHRHRNIMANDAKIIIFQNGFGYDEEYTKYFDADRIFSTAILTGFKRVDSHISIITGHTHPLMIGSLHTDCDDIKIISELMAESGFPSDVTNEVEKDLWAKMLFNCALNPLSAILNVKYGKLAENEYSLNIINQLISETFEVMEKSGHKTNWSNVEEYKEIFFNQFFPDGYEHESSMLEDIKNKNKTEIDSLNGKIVELANNLDMDVPVSRIIVNIIKSIESNF